MLDKFTMELVWHNCKTHPPKETANEKLIMSDGYEVFEAFWYRPDGFMIRGKDKWHGVYDDLNKWYWADIQQTVRGETRFKGLEAAMTTFADNTISLNEATDMLTKAFKEYEDKFKQESLMGDFEQSACTNCPNNIKNGGSGICFCTLGQQAIY